MWVQNTLNLLSLNTVIAIYYQLAILTHQNIAIFGAFNTVIDSIDI